MVKAMIDWTDTHRKAIAHSESLGETPLRQSYISAGLTPPEKATDEYQPAPLWRRFINSLKPVWYPYNTKSPPWWRGFGPPCLRLLIEPGRLGLGTWPRRNRPTVGPLLLLRQTRTNHSAALCTELALYLGSVESSCRGYVDNLVTAVSSDVDGAIRLEGESVVTDSLRTASVEYGGISREPLVGAR